MKKTKVEKKLNLKKETISRLENNELKKIKGGVGTQASCVWYCDISGNTLCA